MRVKLVFLGRLEELARRAFEDVVDPPLGWEDLVAWIGRQYALDLADMIAQDRVKVALNGALVADKRALVLSDGDEVAFLPPVSGG